MRGCVLGPRKPTWCETKLLREGKRIFAELFYVPLPDVVIQSGVVTYRGRDLSQLDFVIPRIPRAYVRLGYTILSLLEGDVWLPIKPDSVYIAHNKFMTLLVLKGAGFPVPNTYLAVSRAQLEDLLDEMRYPVVMKLLYGSLGKGVMFADSKGSAVSMMDTLERFKVPIFLEQYIPNPGEDIRVFVLGARVIGAMKRRAQRDERRANIAIGGRGVAIRLKPEVEFLAIDAAKTLGMDVCGIDVILGPKGPKIIEANVNVHFEELARVTGVNVPRQIVEWIKEEIDLQGQPAIVRFVKKLKRYGFPHLSQLR